MHGLLASAEGGEGGSKWSDYFRQRNLRSHVTNSVESHSPPLGQGSWLLGYRPIPILRGVASDCSYERNQPTDMSHVLLQQVGRISQRCNFIRHPGQFPIQQSIR